VDCFINIHKFFYSPRVFEAILFPPIDEYLLTKDSTSSNSSGNGDSKENEEKGKEGQPSLVSKLSEIIDVTAEFIKQHKFAAHCRHQTETECSSGVTSSQIREHLYKTIPSLKDYTVSLSTIHRLFHALNKYLSHMKKGHVIKGMLTHGLVLQLKPHL